jgi:hypothetical protein
MKPSASIDDRTKRMRNEKHFKPPLFAKENHPHQEMKFLNSETT